MALAVLLTVQIAVAVPRPSGAEGPQQPDPMQMIHVAGDKPSYIKELTLRSPKQTVEINVFLVPGGFSDTAG